MSRAPQPTDPLAPTGGGPVRVGRWTAALAAAALLLTGCGSGAGTAPGGPSGSSAVGSTAAPTPSGPGAAAAVQALSGTGWRLTGLLSSGSTAPVAAGLNGWVRFAPDQAGLQVAFNTSCNRGIGSATVGADGDGRTGEITFDPPRATLIFCDGDSGTTETVMLALLSGPRTFTVDQAAGTLTITSTDGSSGMSFAADPTVGADAFADASADPSASSTAASG